MIRWLSLACVAICACGTEPPPSGFGVNLTISAARLSDDQIARIQLLAVHVSGDDPDTYVKTISIGNLILSREVRAHYVPRVSSGVLSFDVDATDNDGLIIAAGTSGATTLAPNGAVPARIDLDTAETTDGSVDGLPSDLGVSDGGDGMVVALHCVSGSLDGDETDIDCGGADCAPCSPRSHCSRHSDCVTGVCAGGYCALASGPPNWIKMADMPATRSAFGAASGSDGRIYVVAGYTNGFQNSGTAAAYDSNSDTWGAAPDPGAVAGPAVAATSDGRLIAASGGAASGASLVLTTGGQVMQPPNGSWTGIAPMTHIRMGAVGVRATDGSIWVVGGWIPSMSMRSPVSTVERYDVGGNSWADMPSISARAGVAASLGGDGQVYSIGGEGVATVEVFSKTAGSWQTVSPLPTVRGYLSAALGPDGRIYAIGGRTTVVSGVVEAYSTESAAWAAVANLSVPRSELGVAVGPDGRLFAMGGTDFSSTEYKTVEAYGPVVTLSASSGSAGSTIMLSGTNFAANASVSIKFNGGQVASATTNVNGVLNGPIGVQIPIVSAGKATITVVDDRSLYPITKSFTVN